MNKYTLPISAKTRFLNSFRKVFTLPPFESFLVAATRGKMPDSVIGKMVPPSYLYPENAKRIVLRNNHKFELNIHDMVDHYIYFGFAETSRNAMYSLIKPGMKVLDIGANMGETSISFAELVGKAGSVYSFEPDPFNFKKLKRNIEINNISNIRTFQLGLGSENKKAKLYNVAENNRGMNRLLENLEGDVAFAEVNVVTFDSIADEHNIQKIDFIKIDVEGFELNALTGAKQTLIKHKPVLFIELDDENLREQGASASSLVSFLNSLGYTIHHSVTGSTLNLTDDFSSCHYDVIGI